MNSTFFYRTILVVMCFLAFNNFVFSKSLSLNFKQPLALQAQKDATITHLKVSGVINRKTIATLNALYPNIVELNMRDAVIVAFTETNKVVSRANEIPISSFIKKPKLRSVILPRGVVKIGKGAFWSCQNLEQIILPDSLKIIDQFAFQLCGKLRQITFPIELEYIGGASFASCSSLTTIKCTSTTPPQMPEWNPFPDMKPNSCVLLVPSKALAAYQKSPFLNEFLIKALK